ncbi:Hsp70 family protein [Streptomyces gossypii]|uniref:Hsp70 family protein n=1 Tax=Streptomyces gossypii TaxID=2883101 RepID=UPI002882F2DE|nr:Hsp70 family protein [Streptomyces gossypii]
MSVIGIDIGHRYGRIGRMGADGRPVVTTVPLDRLEGEGHAATALAALLGSNAAAENGCPADPTAVLGLWPSDGTGSELRRAAEAAGLTVARLLPEPVAVALHYGAVVEGVNRTVLVCDQGATTLDLTVLDVAPHRTVGILDTRTHRLGGDDWDEAVAAGILRQLPADADSRAVAERLRRDLSPRDDVTASAPSQGQDLEVSLDRATLDRLVAPLREQARNAVVRALTDADRMPDTILLAGGLWATPGAARQLEEGLGLGIQVRCTTPELAVINGLLALEDFGALRLQSGPADQHRGAARSEAPPPPPAEDPEPQPRHHVRDPDPAVSSPTGPAPKTEGAGWTAGPEPESGPQTSGPREPPEPPATPEPPRAPEAPEAPETPPSQATSHGPAPSAASRPADPPEPPGPTPSATLQSPLVAVPVDQLDATRRGSHLLVIWAWPETALSARVRWQLGEADPGHPSHTGELRCLRRVYEHDGGLSLKVGRGAVTLTVEALVADPEVDCEGSSSLLIAAEAPVVEYVPSVRRRIKGRVATVTFTSETACELPAVRIVHGLGNYRPMSLADGTVLHEVPAQRLPARTPLSVEFPLPATRDTSWLVCFPADAAASDIDIRPTALHRLRVT